MIKRQKGRASANEEEEGGAFVSSGRSNVEQGCGG